MVKHIIKNKIGFCKLTKKLVFFVKKEQAWADLRVIKLRIVKHFKETISHKNRIKKRNTLERKLKNMGFYVETSVFPIEVKYK